MRNHIFKKLLAHSIRDHVIIVMLHRVSDKSSNKLFANENMKISVVFLEHFIQDALKKGYTFISIDALATKLQQQQNLYKNIVITLDDGYMDNYTNAYPLFKKYNIPFVIYLSTAFINKEQYPWWYRLEHLLLHRDQFKWNNKIILLSSNDERNDLFLQIRAELLNMTIEQFNTRLNHILEENNYDNLRNENLFLSWACLKEMLNSGLLAIGNHCHNHYHLDKLSDEQFEHEIDVCQEEIFNHLGYTAKHFCYPYGSTNQVVSEEIKSKGFQTATTIRSGLVSEVYSAHMMQLPRIFLTENLFIEDAVSEYAIKSRFGIRKCVA